MSFDQSHLSRRTITKGAAWSVPAVAVAAAAPSLAASPGGAPDLSTSISAGATREGDVITIAPSTIINSSEDTAAEGLVVLFEANKIITDLNLAGLLGITADGFNTTTVTMTVPGGTSLGQVHIEPNGGEYTSPLPQVLTFEEGAGDITLTVTATAGNGGVPFTPPTKTYPAA